jgi:hypothetical protein
LIRQELGAERVECETVDSYQGQENHIIILSLGQAVAEKRLFLHSISYLFYERYLAGDLTHQREKGGIINDCL